MHKDRFSTVGLAIVKNEEDIVEPFVRHNLQFLDMLFVADNFSGDSTRQILAKMQREGLPIIVFDDPFTAYAQGPKMTRFASSITSAIYPDFLAPLDADEFIKCSSREEFFSQLDRIPVGGIGLVPWTTYVITPQDLNEELVDPPRSMKYRRSVELPQHRKLIFRFGRKLCPPLVLRPGNHSCYRTDNEPVPSIMLDDVFLAHFPVRSSEQLAAKAVIGWLAWLEHDKDKRKKGDMLQWRDNFDQIAFHGEIPRDEMPARSMFYSQDDRPKDRPIDWAKDTVLDPMHFSYTRTLSTGKREPLISTIAKSFERKLASRLFTDELRNLIVSRRAKLEIEPGIGEERAANTVFAPDWHLRNPFIDLAPFRYLYEVLRPSSVLDIGCGHGAALLYLQSMGVARIKGIDGFPARFSLLPEEFYQKHDLSKPFYIGEPFDLVMCVEVIEHMDPTLEDRLLASLASHAKNFILFSAAEPGQPGSGHINCRPLAHWIEKWRKLGWQPDVLVSLAFRSLSSFGWLRRNPILLRRSGTCPPQNGMSDPALKRIAEVHYDWKDETTRILEYAFLEGALQNQ
jgi:SAM-dependent methyltransferase